MFLNREMHLKRLLKQGNFERNAKKILGFEHFSSQIYGAPEGPSIKNTNFFVKKKNNFFLEKKHKLFLEKKTQIFFGKKHKLFLKKKNTNFF